MTMNATRRALAMHARDTLTNNTDYDLPLTDFEGNVIAMVDPGKVFEAEGEMTVFFDANAGYSFRAYVSQGYPRN